LNARQAAAVSGSSVRRPADRSAGGLPRAARVAAVRVENYRTVTVTLAAAVDAQPGQFAMLWLPGLDEKPFSLLGGDPLRFTIAAVGPFSRAIHRLVPGDTIWWRGPFGRGFAPGGTRHLLVGGGYGVAPLAFLAGRLPHGSVRAVVGARTADEVLLTAELVAAGADVHVTTDDGSAGRRGVATDAVADLCDAQPADTIYACGPHGMLAAVETLALRRAVAAQLSWEAYMRCAMGICGSCEHGGRLLCADGPVLGAGVAAHRNGGG
jgi:dihydroorotate dehydrogenase electron transfer subunit